MKNKIIIYFCILIISLLAISSVSASEISDDVKEGIDSDINSINTDNVVNYDRTNEAIFQTNNHQLISEDTDVDETSSSDMNELTDKLSSNNNDVLNSDEKTFTELQEIISSTSAPVILENNYVYKDVDSALQEGIKIDGKTITINGKGYAIDGNGQARIFNVINGGHLILKNIKLNNGNHTNGGVIRVQYDSTLTLINCTFANSTSDNGGAIWAQGNLSVSNSTFIYNMADNGGAIYGNHWDLNVTNSTFMQNIANYHGGAIYGASGIITNSTFIQNGFGYYSGIYVTTEYLDIIDSTLIDDTIEGGNAEQYVNIKYLGSFTSLNKIINTTEYDIRLTKDYIYTEPDSNFKNGINITISRTIDGNGHIIDGNGKARIFNVMDGGKLSLRNMSLINAYCEGNGGAINTNGNLTINNSTFLQNNANGNGGAIYANNSNVSITNTLFNKNNASQGDSIYLVQGNANINSSTLIDDEYFSESESSITFDNTTFLGSFIALSNKINSALENSEIILDQDYIYTESDFGLKYGVNLTKSITIDGSGHTINANKISGIFRVLMGVNLKIKNLNIFNTNTTAISTSNNTSLIVINTTFNNCSGGAISCGSNSSLNVLNSTFKQNSARYSMGSAVAIYNTAAAIIINSTFAQNTVQSNYAGGAIYSSGTLNIINCSFNDNIAGGKGGAVYTNGIANITNCTFTNNQANDGGAIYIYSKGTTNIINSTFTKNKADDYGGALNNNGTLNLINSTLTNNQARVGGAIYQDKNKSSLTNCTFNNNDAESGGAIFISSLRLNMTNCTFYKNNAEAYGSVYIWRSNSLFDDIHNCTFIYDTVEFGQDILDLSDSRFIKTFKELNYTLNKNTNDTIYLNFDYRCDDSESSFFNGITINRKVTIYGNGCTIDGNSVARIFDVKNNKVVFKDSVLRNGYPCLDNPANGGAINGQCTVINCTFINNIADNGGAMYEGNAINCTFINNIADNGEAMYEGTAILCMFENNGCYNTVFPVLNISDFTSTYNSGEKLSFNLTYGNQEFEGINATIFVTKINGDSIGTYHALTGKNNGWAVDLPVGVYKAILSLDKYPEINPVNATLTIKYKTNFTIKSIEDSIINQKIIIKVIESNGFNGTVTLKMGEAEYVILLDNGEGTKETTITTPGVYTLTLHFDETENFTEANTDIQFFVKYPTHFTVNEIYNGTTDKAIAISVNEEYGYYGLVDVMIKSDEFTTTTSLSLIDGFGTSPSINLPQGTYKAIITFTGTELYNSTTAESNLFNIKYPTRFIISIGNSTADKPITIEVNEENNYTGEITLTIDNTPYVILLENGVCVNNTIKLKTGTYTATINFDGNDIYNATIAESNEFSVKLANPEFDLKIGDVVEGDPISLEVNAVDTFNGLVEVKIVGNSNVSVDIMVNNGVGIETLLLPAGEYSASINFEGNDEFNSENVNTKFHVKSVIPNNAIIIPSLDTPSSDGTVTITLPSDASGKIILSIGGIDYNFSVVNGVSKVKIPENVVGDYILTYCGDEKYLPFNKTGYLKSKTKITASAVTTPYNVNKYIIITLKDNVGNALSGVNLSVNLNGVKTLTTDKNGQIKLSTNGFAPNTYTAKVTFAGNNKYIGSSINVRVLVKKANVKVTAKAKTFKQKVKTKKYKITLKTNLNKAMKNTKVTLKVNKKTFTAKTNKKGVATFKITNLKKKGKYTAVIKYAGSKYYNKVTKKPKITIKA